MRSGIPSVVFTRIDPDTGENLYSMPIEGGEDPAPFVVEPGDQSQPQMRADGKYIAYVSDESGRNEVYLKEFPSGKGKWQVSVDGGRWPRWSPAGDELFFVQRNPNAFLVVKVSTAGGVLRLGNPEVLFTEVAENRLRLWQGFRYYDSDPNGERFLSVQDEAGQDQSEVGIVVLQNWTADL